MTELGRLKSPFETRRNPIYIILPHVKAKDHCGGGLMKRPIVLQCPLRELWGYGGGGYKHSSNYTLMFTIKPKDAVTVRWVTLQVK